MSKKRSAMTDNQLQRYSNWVITFHWIVVLLMILVYITMEFRGIFDRGTPERELMKTAHYIFGIGVLLLIVPRLIARLLSPKPAILPPVAGYMKVMSTLMHLALYAFMICMPLMGWILINANGGEVVWLGLELPRLVEEDKAFGKQLRKLHEQGAIVGYILIGLHTLAALFHHYVLKNNVLRRISLLKK
jgi:cytochrome b561